MNNNFIKIRKGLYRGLLYNDFYVEIKHNEIEHRWTAFIHKDRNFLKLLIALTLKDCISFVYDYIEQLKKKKGR